MRRTDDAAIGIQVLGRFGVVVRGHQLPGSAWQSRKARDLLRILVARRGRPVARGELAELLWPEGGSRQVGHRLSTQLSLVRTVLCPNRTAGDCIVADRSSVALDLSRVQVDVEQFLAMVAQARQWQEQGRAEPAWAHLVRAERAYQGDPFEDDPYLEAATPLREEARATYLWVVRELAHHCQAKGRTDPAVSYLLRLLARDQYDEPAHQALVTTLVAGGRHGEARDRPDGVDEERSMYRGRHPFRSLLAIGAMLATAAAVIAVPAQPAAASVPSLQVAFADSSSIGGGHQFVVVICPQNQKVYSGGYQLLGDEQGVAITEFMPSNNVGSLRVTAHATTSQAFGSNWQLRAYAWCGAPQPTHVLSPEGSSVHSSSSSKSTVSSCPTGTVTYGVFGRIVDAPHFAGFTTMVSNGGNGAFVQARSLVHNPPPSPWSVRARAICATELPGYVTDLASTGNNQDPVKSRQLRCPRLQNLTPIGGGFAVTGNPGGVLVPFAMTSGAGLPTGQMQVRARAVSTSSSWQLTTEVICA